MKKIPKIKITLSKNMPETKLRRRARGNNLFSADVLQLAGNKKRKGLGSSLSNQYDYSN